MLNSREDSINHSVGSYAAVTESPMQVTKEQSRRWIVCYITIIVAVSVLITPCMGQDRTKVDPAMTAAMIGRVLAKVHASGSLVYHGQCQASGGTWDLPAVNLPKHGIAPVQMLREMFGEDSKMQVAQDANGYIRMAETDVARDLLDLRIVQVSFSTGSTLNNPNIALTQIMGTPEMKDYMIVRNIGPVSDSYRLIVPSSPDAPHISGDLYFVTVSEALDYILKTYPGFWAYEECPGENGGRKVFFRFFPTVSQEVIRFP
jgi:hypothetical protein